MDAMALFLSHSEHFENSAKFDPLIIHEIPNIEGTTLYYFHMLNNVLNNPTMYLIIPVRRIDSENYKLNPCKEEMDGH